MKALSIRQPWPHRIFYAGKDIENRDWATRYRGLFMIHAGKQCDLDEIQRHECTRYPIGGIVGVAEITDCVVSSESEWFFGDFGFVLANPRPIELIPCPGQLNFFDPPPEVVAEVMRRIGL